MKRILSFVLCFVLLYSTSIESNAVYENTVHETSDIYDETKLNIFKSNYNDLRYTGMTYYDSSGNQRTEFNENDLSHSYDLNKRNYYSNDKFAANFSKFGVHNKAMSEHKKHTFVFLELTNSGNDIQEKTGDLIAYSLIYLGLASFLFIEFLFLPVEIFSVIIGRIKNGI